jgi:hypothetical protein
VIRHPALTVQEIEQRLQVDLATGVCVWRDATKHHRPLVGKVAGHARPNHSGKCYWIIKINGIPYRRAQIVLTIATGRWPTDTVDHIDGDSLNDCAANLRHATIMQNAWNHKRRAKTASTPMGVRMLPSGRYQVRIAVNKKQIHVGTFSTVEAASAAYQQARKENYGAFC